MTIDIQTGMGVDTEDFAEKLRTIADGIDDSQVMLHGIDTGVSVRPEDVVDMELELEFSVTEDLSNELAALVTYQNE